MAKNDNLQEFIDINGQAIKNLKGANLKHLESDGKLNPQNYDLELSDISIIPEMELIPSTDNQIIGANHYTQGKLTIKGDTHLKSENIKKGITIFNIVGNLEDAQTYNDYVNNKLYAVQLPPYYAVKFTSSNSVGERYGKSKNFVVEVAHSLQEHARNDFDNVYPFNQIRRVMNNGREMIQIPKFYIWVSLDFTDIRISEFKLKNFALPNAFKDVDGSELPYTQIGAYFTSNGSQCQNGAKPQSSKRRSYFRDNARAIGKGWCDIDIHAWQLYWVLWLIVTADRNSDRFMSGNTSGALINNGGTREAISTLVQIGNNYQSFYGIENMYSNLYTFIDGINFNNEQIYTCNDFNKYADDTATNYENTGTRPTSDGFIVSMKKLSNGIIYADGVSGGSATTYWCDKHNQGSGWRILLGGRRWDDNNEFGLFYLSGADSSTLAYAGSGSRLVYRPLK